MNTINKEWRIPTIQLKENLDWESIEKEFDWLTTLRSIPQDKIWHQEGDVFTHTKMVVEALIKLDAFRKLEEYEQYILFLSALFHDIEKRSTTSTEEIDGIERIVSPNHAKKGAHTVRSILFNKYDVPFMTREHISNLVRLHGLPLWAIDRENPSKEVIKSSLMTNNHWLSILATADVLGRICNDKEHILFKIELFEELCKENNCWTKPYQFASNYGRYLYLNKSGIAPFYKPFEDLTNKAILLAGLPGVGKDTFIKKHFPDIPMVSLDEIRRKNNFDPTNSKHNGKVVQIAKEEIKVLLRKKSSFIFNATNLSQDIRQKWIGLFIDYKARVKIIYLEKSLEDTLKQNKDRKWTVPENVIHKLSYKLEVPLCHEAHDLEYITQ
ncbi:AAA family ATPase [Flammeovirga kamogawensis]|uniref:AAA family ATPase n=1 Tax=Flammeovirga kamogawensis TaxID=373891 RepID=A0ABX8GT66_9BACT|nr:AAA family ATPase [Flammeovirga kamogawensis]MBB6463976.1 putative nucleotidyltransferase with HDIG domain [Flammeovirga kamogawensis]QWG06603.1 AAA family ATPase [Flammeovirga kamogawensis]TRX68427.1 AAA family ATPase [Flammeovirga kamogawensis]